MLIPLPKTKVEPEWIDIVMSIPGYDPIKTSGDCWFDSISAQRVIDFFSECLTHVKGPKAKTPFHLELWQKGIVANLFGWKRANGTRRYREAFIKVPRKNGKSALAAGIVNYCTFCDGEYGAENYSAAAERGQAALVFDQAKGMILNEPELNNRAQIYVNSIVIPDSNGGVMASYKAISADANTKHGFNPHIAIVDELHAQPNRNLVDVLSTGMGARPQPLMIYITTSDYERPSICNEKDDYAHKVRDGILEDTSFFPVIYEATIDDDWKNESTWYKANPNLGISVDLDYFRRECKKAQETPTFENTFKRLNLNIKTEQDIRWIPIEDWDKCNHAGPIDITELIGRPCYGGLDLANTSDLAAFVLHFPEDGHKILPFFWVPKITAEQRERKQRVPYLTWIRQGFIEGTEGNTVDYDAIRARINELSDSFDIKEIAIDRWNANQISTQLTEDGFEIVPFGQGVASMSAPSKEFERMIKSQELDHGGHPVLRWNVSNVSVEMDAAGNIKPSRKKSHEKIDGVVALVMALGRSTVATRGTSIYEERGVLTI